MLTLGRHEDESVFVGDIQVTVLMIQHDKLPTHFAMRNIKTNEVTKFELSKNESRAVSNDASIHLIGVSIQLRRPLARLGIVAPRDMPIHRQEVWEAIHGTSAQPVKPPDAVDS
jgi:carbon storage regulator